MGLFGHSNKTFNNTKVVNCSIDLIEHIEQKLKNDSILDIILSVYGKNKHFISTNTSENTLEILKDKKILFEKYFKKFNEEKYIDTLSVFTPEYNESWINHDENNMVNININDTLPKGIILSGFDYKTNSSGWLSCAVEKKNHVILNPSEPNKLSNSIIWSN